MVRINTKTIDDFLAKAQDALQNSLIETSYSFTYQTGTLNYVFEGFAIDNERIFSIVSIEGTGFLPEDYLTEDTLTEGIDYTLYDNYNAPEIVPDNYGVATGNQVYTGITITDQTFKDGGTIHVKYKYQNPNYIPILTNFSPNSTLRMILTASLINMQETNEELTQSIETYGLDATGTDLDRIATLVGKTRDDAAITTGQIKLYNNDTTADYAINTSHRFAAIAGGTYLAFAPLTGLSVPKWDGVTIHDDRTDFVFINVTAIASGSYYNVGSNSIGSGFTNITLTSATPSTLIISNPPLGDIGQQNLFNNGTDDETDTDFRNRVSIAFSQTKTSSYSTLEQAVIDTNLIRYVNVYDLMLKKDLIENAIQTYVATELGNRLSSATLSQINDAIAIAKPVGSRNTVRQTLSTFINFDVDIYINQNSIGDTTALNTQLNLLLDEFINTKGIGKDILPSTVVSILKGVSEVLDVVINSHTITEYASEAAIYDGQEDIAIASVEQQWIALEVPFNSATYLHNEVESGMTGTLELDTIAHAAPNNLPVPVDSRTQPRVSIGVTAYDGVVRPSPLDRTDYWLGGDRNTITYDAATVGGDGINTTDLVLFNYNYFDNMLLDGLRIRLGGSTGAVIGVDFGYGSDPDNVNFYSFVTDESVLDAMTITLTQDEPKMYDVPFLLSAVATQLDMNNYTDGVPPNDWSPDSTNFYIILKYVSGVTAYLPVDTQQTTMAFSPTLSTDATKDGLTFETITQQRANWHSYTTYSLANAYKKITIPSQTDEPEKPISYTHTFNFSLFVEE